MILYLALAPFGLFTAFRIYNLLHNYIAARSFGLPVIIIPVSFEDAWWILLRPLFSWVEQLPFGLGGWYLYTEMGWPIVDGNKTVQRLGENFVLCSPSSNQIVTCYEPGVQEAFRNHKNWPQPEAQSQLFAFYGQNVSSTNGAEWQRHRKITASAFNENCMEEVWKETIKRTKDIDLTGECARSLGRIRTTFDVLAMHVLAVVGFGQDMPLTNIPPGHRESLMNSLGFMLKHIMLTLIFNSLKAPNFLLPDVLRRLKTSVNEFRLYMEESVLRHMQSTKTRSNSSRTPTSLLEAMVRANEAEKQQLQKSISKPSYLSDSELYGNLFVFNLAGYETTAGTLTFALSFLAANAEMQDWVIEEVDRYYASHPGVEYSELYPKLIRTLSTMYETLRLASPAPLLVRSPKTPQELPITTPNGPSTIAINPETLVGAHFYGAHLSPLWGSDADTFNPKRFVSTSASGEESLTVPEGPLYFPWVFGPRVCPGKKFSQVEFAAVIVQILSEFRIEVLQYEHESQQQAKARLMDVLDHKFFNISAHLRRPEDAGVRFVRRKKD